MKMLTIICRERFQDEVLVLLERHGVSGYTMINGAGGSGETGKVSGTHGWTDRNKLFLVALEDDLMSTLIEGVKTLHVNLVEQNQRYKVPFKAFVQPCDVVV